MKKNYLILLTVLGLMLGGCVKELQDPVPFGNSGFNILIEGVASPDTLYIPKNLIPQITTITVKVSSERQIPLAGREVIFQQFEGDGETGMSWGYFEGQQISLKKQVDSNGEVRVNYYFPGQYTVAQDTLIYIRVALIQIDNNREFVYDMIPIRLIVYNN